METVILDDNIEYLVIETMVIDNTEYTLFLNESNEEDFCFRKTIYKDGQKYFAGLQDRNEFEKVLLYFTKKMIS